MTGIGAAAAVVTAITAVGCMAATASASVAKPAAPVRAAVVAAASARTAPATPAYVPPKRNLAEGMSGADVKALQQRLDSLKYYPGAINGVFGSDTLEAVWAFQEVNGLTADGVVGPHTKAALVHPRAYRSNDPRQDSTRIEVNLGMRVLVLYKNDQIYLVSHVSSGGGYYFCNPDGSCGYAITPTGNYRTTEYLPGWVQVPLGEMYNPVFFIGTVFAIHGEVNSAVPVNPVSHGCVRIPFDIAQFFHTLVKTPGTEVFIYNHN